MGSDASVPRQRTFVDSLKDYWPYLAAIVAAGWTALQWMADQRKIADDRRDEADKLAEVRLFEARKPFKDLRLKLYVETSQIVGQLVTAKDVTSPAWAKAFDRFEQLYWSELSMVEDDGVKGAMMSLGGQVRSMNNSKSAVGPAQFEELQALSYRLARALNEGIEKTWVSDLPKLPARQ